MAHDHAARRLRLPATRRAARPATRSPCRRPTWRRRRARCCSAASTTSPSSSQSNALRRRISGSGVVTGRGKAQVVRRDRRRPLGATGERRGERAVEPAAPSSPRTSASSPAIRPTRKSSPAGVRPSPHPIRRSTCRAACSQSRARHASPSAAATGAPSPSITLACVPRRCARRRLCVAQMSLDPRGRQRWTGFGRAPDGCIQQPKLGAACSCATLATVDAFADVEQISQVVRRAACEAQRGRSVAGARSTQRQQRVVACQIAGLGEDAVDAAREIRSPARDSRSIRPQGRGALGSRVRPAGPGIGPEESA